MFGHPKLRKRYSQRHRPRVTPLTDPTDLPELAWWVRADLGITENPTGFCQAWADQSGNGLNFSQANSALKPQINRTTLNGIAVVDCDGTEYMTQGTIAAITQPGHIFAVSRGDDANENVPIIGGVNAGNNWSFGYKDLGAGDGFQWLLSSPNDRLGGSSTTGWHIIHCFFSGGTTSYMEVDDYRVIGPINCGSNDCTGSMLFTKTVASSIGDGAMAEAMLFDGTLTADEILQTKQYLREQWDLP